MGARYSRHSGYTISKRHGRATVRTVPRKVGFGPNAARYFGLGLLAVIALVMLTQSSTRATSAYTENDLAKQISQVNGDIDALRLEARRVQSLQNLQDSAAKKDMEPIKDVTYVEKGEVAGARTERQAEAQP